MSLSALETALANYVADVIVNDCDRPELDRILRYHGGPVPEDCCTENGLLVVWWESVFASSTFPGRSTDPCTGPPVAQISLKYVVCWPAADVTGGAIILADDDWDGRAAALADVADCVERALKRLSCNPDKDDPIVAAVLDEQILGVRWTETIPNRPSGQCAGVTWRLFAGVRSAQPVS